MVALPVRGVEPDPSMVVEVELPDTEHGLESVSDSGVCHRSLAASLGVPVSCIYMCLCLYYVCDFYVRADRGLV